MQPHGFSPRASGVRASSAETMGEGHPDRRPLVSVAAHQAFVLLGDGPSPRCPSSSSLSVISQRPNARQSRWRRPRRSARASEETKAQTAAAIHAAATDSMPKRRAGPQGPCRAPRARSRRARRRARRGWRVPSPVPGRCLSWRCPPPPGADADPGDPGSRAPVPAPSGPDLFALPPLPSASGRQ